MYPCRTLSMLQACLQEMISVAPSSLSDQLCSREECIFISVLERASVFLVV
jgi:hypothetical protein